MHSSNRYVALFGILILTLILSASKPATAASPVGDVVGKITVGYQGWFAVPGDGTPINIWWHWSPNGQQPNNSNNSIHAWPDMREFVNQYQTGYANLGNGQPAKLFSSDDQQVVDTQFLWMQQNGIDTAALQRFNPTGGEGPERNQVTQKVISAAQSHNVKFYIMYDVSGWTSFETQMENDWSTVINNNTSINVTASPMYAKQNGKPVVCIWGFGFNDGNHPTDSAACLRVINWFKSQGCYVIGGVPSHWRTGDSDSVANFLSVYHAFNMISPWMVGRIGTAADSDNFRTNVNNPDIADCVANGVDYQPCVLPGDTGQRAHGDFMWHQFGNMIQAGSQGIYISMFDEFNEGNQIAKTAEDSSMSPVGGPFFTLDQDGVHCSSDYYLRLTNDGGKMLKGQIPFTWTRPTQPVLTNTPPPTPTGLTAAAGNTQITLTWSQSSGAASYNVYRSTSAGGEGTTALVTGISGATYTNTGLTNGTTYFYKVAAVNSFGTSAQSSEASATPTNGVAGIDLIVTSVSLNPASPSNGNHVVFSAVVKNQGSVATPSGTIIGCQFAVDGVTTPINWSDTDTTSLAAGASVTLTANNGTSGVNYWTATTGSHTVQAWVDDVNRIAESNENNNKLVASFTVASGVIIPPVPTGLTATAGNTQVSLSWGASSGATSYNVYRGTTSGGEGTTAIATATTTSFTNTGLTNGTTYFYKVAAVNSAGTSAQSGEASATPVAGLTPVVQIDAGSTSGVSPFVADVDFNSGNMFSSTATVNTSGASNPAPAAVYQTVRWNSSFTYTIPNLTANAGYTVRLHFAELTWTAAGQRKFNVAINGTSVLSAFDIFATAGGQNRATTKQFTTTANASGQIVIAFTQGGADNPEVAGIEILH